MTPILKSVFFSLVFVAFLAAPTTVLDLDIETSICYEINEEEHERISEVDIKEIPVHNSVYCLLMFDDYGAAFHATKESSIKSLAKETTSPPPENLV